MIVVTCDEIPGRRISGTLGMVKGSAVRARPIFSNLMAMLRVLVGGEIPEYTKILAETREQCLDRMQPTTGASPSKRQKKPSPSQKSAHGISFCFHLFNASLPIISQQKEYRRISLIFSKLQD